METNYNPLNQEFHMSNPDIETRFNDILKSFGKDLQEIETEIKTDKQKRLRRIQSIKKVLAIASLLVLTVSISAKDLCSKKGTDELLRSSSYPNPTKFFFKYDCKKSKTYFTEEQARMINDRLDKEYTFTVRFSNEENLLLTANRKGIIRTGYKITGQDKTVWKENNNRLRQLGLAEWN